MGQKEGTGDVDGMGRDRKWEGEVRRGEGKRIGSRNRRLGVEGKRESGK